MKLPVTHLNIGIPEILAPNILLTNYINSEKLLQQFEIDFNFFSDELKTFIINVVGSKPFWCELFYTPPRHENPIHIDGSKIQSHAKMNWIFGGSNSALRGFEIKNGKMPELRNSQIKSPYLKFTNEEVNQISEDKIGFPSIIDAGLIPHQVVNYGPDPRWCLTMSFALHGRVMTYDELVQKFKNYILK